MIPDDMQRRGWCMDYALRIPRFVSAPISAEEIIKDAKKFENYILGKPKARVLKLAVKAKK